MRIYIGIRKPSKDRKGNIGTTWEEQVNGSYICKETRKVLKQWQIENDFRLGYLEIVP
jgi:hypothetical protein